MSSQHRQSWPRDAASPRCHFFFLLPWQSRFPSGLEESGSAQRWEYGGQKRTTREMDLNFRSSGCGCVGPGAGRGGRCGWIREKSERRGGEHLELTPWHPNPDRVQGARKRNCAWLLTVTSSERMTGSGRCFPGTEVQIKGSQKSGASEHKSFLFLLAKWEVLRDTEMSWRGR